MTENKSVQLSELSVGDKFIPAEDWYEDYDWSRFYQVMKKRGERIFCLKPSGYMDYLFRKMQVIKLKSEPLKQNQ